MNTITGGINMAVGIFKKCDNCPVNPKECKLFDLILPVFTIEELESDLISAIQMLYMNDSELLEKSINECCLNAYIFHYFSELHGEKYKGYRIDPEYNRNGKTAKYYHDVYNDKDRYAIPDTIIHVRDCNKYNLLYIEYKKTICSENDISKIIRFTADDITDNNAIKGKAVPYRFKYGVAVQLRKAGVLLHWFDKTGKVYISEYKLKNGILTKVKNRGRQ